MAFILLHLAAAGKSKYILSPKDSTRAECSNVREPPVATLEDCHEAVKEAGGSMYTGGGSNYPEDGGCCFFDVKDKKGAFYKPTNCDAESVNSNDVRVCYSQGLVKDTYLENNEPTSEPTEGVGSGRGSGRGSASGSKYIRSPQSSPEGRVKCSTVGADPVASLLDCKSAAESFGGKMYDQLDGDQHYAEDGGCCFFDTKRKAAWYNEPDSCTTINVYTTSERVCYNPATSTTSSAEKDQAVVEWVETAGACRDIHKDTGRRNDRGTNHKFHRVSDLAACKEKCAKDDKCHGLASPHVKTETHDATWCETYSLNDGKGDGNKKFTCYMKPDFAASTETSGLRTMSNHHRHRHRGRGHHRGNL